MTLHVDDLPPRLDGEQLEEAAARSAPPGGSEPGATAPTERWPEEAIGSLRGLIAAPFEIAATRYGPWWSLNDQEADGLARALAGVVPYSSWVARAGAASPWLVLGGQAFTILTPRIQQTRAAIAAGTIGGDGRGHDDDANRPGAARAGSAEGDRRDPGADPAAAADAAETGGDAFARSAVRGVQELRRARGAA